MSEGPLEYETVLELYQSKHRRVALAVLIGEQQALTLDDLTKTVLKHTHQKSVSDASTADRRQIRISLHHHHLPKLADAGLITYYADRKLVVPTEKLDHIQPQPSALINPDPELEDPLEL